MSSKTNSAQPAVSPLVSVCVPTYNDDLFLRQSLASILSQTYTKLEVLVGDDASTDNTAEIVQSFGDSRVAYHKNPTNLGQFENVNTLVKRAKGEFVAIYHSDDVYSPDIVKKEIEYLAEHPEVGAVFTLNWQINEGGSIIGKTEFLPGSPESPFTLSDVLPFFLKFQNRLLIGPTFMGRARVFDQVGLFRSDFEIAGDFEMWTRILEQFKVAVLPEHLIRYRRGRSQVSHGYNYLRTFENHFFCIIDNLIDRHGIADSLDRKSLIEYSFHRCDDEVTRAANYVLLGESKQASKLLKMPYPWRTLLNMNVFGLWRRKIRVLLLKLILTVGLMLNQQTILCDFISWLEYGEPAADRTLKLESKA